MKRAQLIKLALFIFFILIAVITGLSFPRLTLPFGFSYIVYLMARPLTLRLTIGTKHQRIINSIFLAIILSSFLIPLIVSLYGVDTNFTKFNQEIPEIKKILDEKFLNLKDYIFDKFGYEVKIDPVSYLISSLENYGALFLAKIPDFLSSLFEWFLLVPMFLYFFFRESQNFNKWLLAGVPNAIFEKSYVLFSQFNTKFGEYIIAKFVEATLLGILVWLGLVIIDFPYAFLFAIFAAITNILPYLGPVIGYSLPLLFAVISKDPNSSVLGVTVVFGIANLVDMILVFPLLVSKIVNLHPIIVIVSIIIGSQVGGIVGMIVIIPFIAFFKILFRELYKDLSVNT